MEPFIGMIVLFAGEFVPRGWAACDGRTLSIRENQSLFSLVGTTYGGDGRTTFALPDLRESAPRAAKKRKSVGYIIAMRGIYPSRD